MFLSRIPGGDRYERALRQRGVETVTGDDRLKEALARDNFDLALIAFWYLGADYLPTIRRLAPDTKVVIDSIDLHFVRRARGVFQGAVGAGAAQLDGHFAKSAAAELNAYAAADRVLTVSDKEAALLNDLLNVAGHAVAVPDCEEEVGPPLGFEDRSGILFLGNFLHPPNVDAVHFLCEEVVPALPPAVRREHPTYVVGNEMNEEIRTLCGRTDGVEAVGWVPTVQPYLSRTRVTVAPLRYGAGTKRKLIQALGAGTPTVTTHVGVDGMGLHEGEGVLIADDPSDIAHALERLLEDQELWEDVARRGRERVVAAYDTEVVRACFSRAIAFDPAPARPTTEPVLTRML